MLWKKYKPFLFAILLDPRAKLQILDNDFDEPSTSQTSKILEKNEEEDIFEKLLADQITADTEDEFSKYFKEGPVNRKVCFKISKLFNLNVFLLILSD